MPHIHLTFISCLRFRNCGNGFSLVQRLLHMFCVSEMQRQLWLSFWRWGKKNYIRLHQACHFQFSCASLQAGIFKVPKEGENKSSNELSHLSAIKLMRLIVLWFISTLSLVTVLLFLHSDGRKVPSSELFLLMYLWLSFHTKPGNNVLNADNIAYTWALISE